MPCPFRFGPILMVLRCILGRRRPRTARRRARRLPAFAAIYEGASRAEAARIGGVTIPIVGDWVVKFNAHRPAGLIDRKAPGQPPRLPRRAPRGARRSPRSATSSKPMAGDGSRRAAASRNDRQSQEDPQADARTRSLAAPSAPLATTDSDHDQPIYPNRTKELTMNGTEPALGRGGGQDHASGQGGYRRLTRHASSGALAGTAYSRWAAARDASVTF